MPGVIYAIGFALPVTYFIEILWDITLRWAALGDLVPHVIGLSICGVVILGLSLTRFKKQLD